jgi:hypothetical protein
MPFLTLADTYLTASSVNMAKTEGPTARRRAIRKSSNVKLVTSNSDDSLIRLGSTNENPIDLISEAGLTRLAPAVPTANTVPAAYTIPPLYTPARRTLLSTSHTSNIRRTGPILVTTGYN